jgi:hypothetical protein
MKGRVRVGYRLFSEFERGAFQFSCGPKVFIENCAQVRGAVHKRVLWDSREWSSNPRIESTEIKVSSGSKKPKRRAAGLGPLDEDIPRTERQLIKVTRS